jgi:hypothetical protein
MCAGYTGRTLVYGVVAGFWLYAICRGGKAEGTPEALQQLETTTGGGVILFVVFAGLALYAIWGFIAAIWDVADYGRDAKRMVARGHDRDGSHPRRDRRPRLLAPLPRSRRGGRSTIEKTAARVMTWPAGHWIVGVAGVTILSAGL